MEKLIRNFKRTPLLSVIKIFWCVLFFTNVAFRFFYHKPFSSLSSFFLLTYIICLVTHQIQGHSAYSGTEVSTHHSPTRKSVEFKPSPLITGSAPATPLATQMPCFFPASNPSIEISSCVSRRLSQPVNVNKTDFSGKFRMFS